MVDEALISYIKSQLKRGFSVQDVTNFLLQKGYNQQSINECISQIYAHNSANHPGDKTKHVNFIVIIAFLVILILGLGFFLFFSSQGPEESNVDFTLEFSQVSFSEDEQVSFTRVLKLEGDSTVSVRLIYNIKDSSGKTVHTMSEDALLTSDSSKEIIADYPNFQPGTYSVEAKISYGGKTGIKTSSFMIQSEEQQPLQESCYDNVKNQDEEGIDCGGPCKACIRQCPIYYDDENDCTIDKCGSDTNYIPVYEDIVPCCGNNICELDESEETCEQDCNEQGRTDYFNNTITPNLELVDDNLPLTEQIEVIKEISKTDVNQASALCDAIIFSYYRDECFYEIAQDSNEEMVCRHISEERSKDKCYIKMSKVMENAKLCSMVISGLRRDSCYMRFALKGDFSVCDKIEDDYYVQSCRQLEEIGKHAPEAIEEYSQKIE